MLISIAGYSSKIPCTIVFGPIKYRGMSWASIYIAAIYKKLKLLIGSIRLQDMVGKMLQFQITWLQLFAGTGECFLQSNTEVSYLPKGWIMNLHQQLVAYDIKVSIGDGWCPTVQRTEDRVIMDVVQEKFPKWTWAGINSCRLFLKATTIADIATLGGTYIPEHISNICMLQTRM